MLPLSGDGGFFGERNKDDISASITILEVCWLSIKVKMTKAICFTAKPNFLSPRCTFLQPYFMQSPFPGCSPAEQCREDADGRAASNPAASGQRPARRFKGWSGEIL